MRRALSLFFLFIWMLALWLALDWSQRPRSTDGEPADLSYSDYFEHYLLPALPVADGFDFPLRAPDANGAAVTLGFNEENHLGEDWNTAPGDKDIGEPVYSIADGWVTLAVDFEGMWGKVVLIASRLPENDPSKLRVVETMYAHLDTMSVKPFTFVKRGQRIGTVGNVSGAYKAHLHWELRDAVGRGLGGGFSERVDGWLSPSEFVATHRPASSKTAPKWKKLPASQRAVWGFDG